MMVASLYRRFASIAARFTDVVVLLIRVQLGSSFFLNGKAKIANIDGITSYFQQLGIIWPRFNAWNASVTECVGGLLLAVGLGTRVVSVPLAFVMIVAAATGTREAVEKALDGFGDAPLQKFSELLSVEEFRLLFLFLFFLTYGGGKFAADRIAARFFRSSAK
jgi:putative oxidoreductase